MGVAEKHKWLLNLLHSSLMDINAVYTLQSTIQTQKHVNVQTKHGKRQKVQTLIHGSKELAGAHTYHFESQYSTKNRRVWNKRIR